MPKGYALVFVLAPRAALPEEPTAWDVLVEAQRHGVGSGVALRLFRTPSQWTGSLDDLVSVGVADVEGGNPFQDHRPAPAPADGSEWQGGLLCDAVVPHLEARSLWIGVYELSGAPTGEAPGHPADRMRIEAVRCLDRFPLRDAANETCWFYPTDNGTYLSWENQRRLTLWPGHAPDEGVQEELVAFERQDLHVLWSLMADDRVLTCVGLTYRGRRIEWPVLSAVPEDCATWTCFHVDAMADPAYEERSTITVFPPPA